MPTLKEMLLCSEQLTVVCAGDSHMWGQGARGWKQAMPDAVAGEPRRLPSCVPCFAAMLGRYLDEVRGPGKTVLINSGMGSTSTKKYMECYWDSMVKRHNPDIVIYMSAINDWIISNGVSLDEYKKTLYNMTCEVFAMNSELVMITQSPILGNQYSGDHYYDEYIEEFRQVVSGNPRIHLADANLRMKEFLSDGDFNQNAELLYEDNWHVSQVGQYIYLKTITDAMGI